MSFDPKFTFWLGIAVTIAIGVTNGTVHLTDIVPPEYVKPATAWMGLLAFVGSTVTTAMAGMSSSKAGPLAAKGS